MLKQVLTVALLFTLGMVGISYAQTFNERKDVPMPPVIESPERPAEVATTDYQGVPTQALLTNIVTWISANFDLPAIHDHPRVELIPPMKIAALRYRGLISDHVALGVTANGRDASLNNGPDTVAIYDDARRTIYLPEAWTGNTPADISVLVHEMVHHLQNVAGLKYECPQAREKTAYIAQERWLRRFNRGLEEDFGIDPFTIFMRSACMNN